MSTHASPAPTSHHHKPTPTPARPTPLLLLQDYSSDFESGEADAAALRAADTWEPDPGKWVAACLALL